MTIQKGQQWGEKITVPVDTRDVDSDYQLSLGQTTDMHIVTAGDLFVALGQPSRPQIGQQRTVVHIDALRCVITSKFGSHQVLASSSVTIGQWQVPPWRHDRFICITNSGIYRGLNIAPRAHPNDGTFYLVEIDQHMSWRQRITSRRRAQSGNHVPHPDISTQRMTSTEVSRNSPRDLLVIDEQRIPHWDSVTIDIVPDYWQVIV